MNSYLI